MNDHETKLVYDAGLAEGYKRGVADVIASLGKAAEKLRQPIRGSVDSKETGRTYTSVVLESPRTHLALICDQIAEIISQEMHHDPRPHSGVDGRPTSGKPN